MARKKWTAQEILERVRGVAAEMGAGVTLRVFLAESGVPESQMRRQFGTWEALRRQAGLSAADRDRRRVSDEELLREYHRLWGRLRRTPSAGELDRLGRYSARTYYTRFGRRKQVRRAFHDWMLQFDRMEQGAADSAGVAPREGE